MPSPEPSDDKIVISGMSGAFPSSQNIKEFEANLYNKIYMVNDDESRWAHTNENVPRYSGKIPAVSKFDSTFFGVHKLQADNMDPQNRMLIEEAFKAVMDAGINPFSLRGSKTGVYVGACVSESENQLFYDVKIPSGFGVTGCSKAMFANRISYILGLNGPSLLCDTACSSSLYAFNLAFQALKNGEIDKAIVGGSNLCLHPSVSLGFNRLGVISETGKVSSFDECANGYVRSETVSCVLLQRKSTAKRIYAELVYSKTNCDGFKAEGITHPSGTVQAQLLTDVYSMGHVHPNDLGFLEAHSTGTVVGDPEECNSIDRAICSRRSHPLLIGSVKSNCGHAEPAAGMVSVVKVLLTMQNNLIPPNINFKVMRQQIKSLREGRLKVVIEPTKLPKPYVGINSFGFGGANAHIVLKQYEKEKTQDKFITNTLPRLVIWSSRTEENAFNFLDDLEKRPLDSEYLALVESAQAGGIQGMVFRGYSILKPSTNVNGNPIVHNKSVQHNGGIRRPLVWVFSGMGSQWVGMGKTLMQLPLFVQSIQRSQNILKPAGLDLVKIITSTDPNVLSNVLHSFVGIASIQIGLVDMLRALGVVPDFIIGHSLGELACGYADGCLTAEQVLLGSYYRGRVSIDQEKIKGSMAAIGMGYNDIKPMLPDTIDIGCHNSADSCTITGPADDVEKFVAQLKAKNIFAREVACANIAYHSRYISHFGEDFTKYLKHVIPKPQLRSNKWISSSVPKNQWFTDESKYSSAEYHVHNMLSEVLFEEASTFLPKNALTIEIAPHALLHSILKSAVADGVHISLTKRGVDDSTLFFLNALGSLYINGIEMNVHKLYPEVQFPVSRGTSTISHLIEFDHSHDCYLYKYEDEAAESGIQTFSLNLSAEHQYLIGHEIDGRTLVPATFYLECVWHTFASFKGVKFENLAVEFRNVNFIRIATLTETHSTELLVIIQIGTGKFEISESQSVVATGYIHDIIGKTKPITVKDDSSEKGVTLKKRDFYKELKLRGYHYSGDFQGVELASADSSYGKVKWSNNWVTFLDCMLQMSILGKDSRSLMLPTKIRTLRIYPKYHQSMCESSSLIEVFSNSLHKRVISGGIEMVGLNASEVQRRKSPGVPVLEKYQFVPHFPAPKLSLDDIARCCIQLVLENQTTNKLKIIQHANEKSSKFLSSLIQAVGDFPIVTGDFMVYNQTEDISQPIKEIPNVKLIYTDDILEIIGDIVILSDNDRSSTLIPQIAKNGFLILRDSKNIQIDKFVPPSNFVPIAFLPSDSDGIFVLLQKTENVQVLDDIKCLKISTTDIEFEWIKKLQDLNRNSKNILLVSQNEELNGILGVINCLRKEPETKNIRCVLIDDPKAPAFNVNAPLYKNQLQLGLALNVYRKGTWGTYRHLKIPQVVPIQTHEGHVFGKIGHIGDLSSLKWVQGPLTKQDASVKIVYSSLNFRDIMIASGRLSVDILELSRINQTSLFGFEYSGIDLKSGKPVMGMSFKSTVGSHIGEQTVMTWNVPPNWSLRDAATVPVVYLTVYYAFFFTVDIRHGKSVLIHAGSGGIGMAAIRVALAYGLEVFTTVSTQQKKSFLLKTFPELKENNIGNSRDTSFENMVLERTQGKGVDFVLNSLSEDKLIASLRCLSKRGHFLEIGKFDMANDNDMGLGVFLKELSFHAVLADKLFECDEAFIKKLKNHISTDIAKGIIQPLPSTIFAAKEIEKAFRYLMSGKHIGKVLIQIRQDPESDFTLPISAVPQIYFLPSLTYIVLGGLGGFGLELVDWMILRGARKIVLSSRRGISNDYQLLRISIWKKYSCEIIINRSDIGTADGCRQLLIDAMKQGDVGGIFNLAVELKDAIFPNQSAALFQQSFKPKALATKHLDEISRKLCLKLHHFVVFSSVSCGRGNAGQTNYGMANSIMERIIENRVSQGLPGKAIQWGAVGEVGLVAEMAAGKIDLEIGGTLQQRISSCIEVLDVLLSSPEPIVASMVVAEKKDLNSGQSPIDFVLKSLSIRDIKSVSVNSTLSELGMDSMICVEIKQYLERNHDIVLNHSDLRLLTISKLIEISSLCDGKSISTTKLTEVVENADGWKMLYANAGNNWKSTAIFDKVNQLTDGLPIIVIPGVDGRSGDIWHTIGNGLKSPTYVLQFENNTGLKSIDDIVLFAVKNITKLLTEKRITDFKIVAYSFGAMVALMTIEKLEKNGFQGSVILIDGSPKLIECLFNAVRQTYSEDDLEIIIISTVLNIILPELSLKTIYQNLHDKKLKSDLWQYVREALQKHNTSDIQNLMDYFMTIVIKLKIMQNPKNVQFLGTIRSKVLLLKPTKPTVSNIDEHYGLKLHTTNNLQIQILEGNHETILRNKRLPEIINQYFNYI